MSTPAFSGPSQGQAASNETLINVSRFLPGLADRLGDRPAIVAPDGAGLSFRELEGEVNRYVRGLRGLGISRGTKTLLMVRPSPDFFALTFALFRIGAVLVMIDPGMGRKGFLGAVKEARPEAFVGIPLAHLFRVLFRRAFDSVRPDLAVTVGRRWLPWGGATLEALRDPDASSVDPAPTTRDETAAILFTSGSTGPAKGAVYTHGIFDAQVRLIQEEFGIQEGEVDLPAFPLFALFSCALGATCVIPDMDPSRPAEADGKKIIEAIQEHGVTYSFGSPAFWHQVGTTCAETGASVPSLRRVFMAGAPVATRLLERFRGILSEEGDVFIPYGATEALPVSWVSGSEILEKTREDTARGAGTCVGRPLAVNTVRIIRICEEPIELLEDAEILGPTEIGEIMVRGPIVTRSYYAREDDTRLAKIADGDMIWHRMGDLGYFDEEGRLWFCGRKNHRLETEEGPMYTVCCEAIFNAHRRVYRSALVGVGPRSSKKQRPVIVVECDRGQAVSGKRDRETLTTELLDMGHRSPLTRVIADVFFHPGFPVDTRHNAKIRREDLALWVEKRLWSASR